jgi:hypothetical protein
MCGWSMCLGMSPSSGRASPAVATATSSAATPSVLPAVHRWVQSISTSRRGAVYRVRSAAAAAHCVGIEVVAYDNAGFVAGTAVTNSSGQYAINGLVAGTYRLRTANVSGYVDRVYQGDCLFTNARVR